MFRNKILKGVELLEPKRFLACDVAFDGRMLEIHCDDAGDLILVRQQAGDLWVGLDNLGSAENLTDIEIDSGGGNDTVIVQNLEIPGNVEVSTGHGKDVVVAVGLVIGNDLEIKTGADADWVFFQNNTVVENSAEIKTGADHDTVFARFGTLTAYKIEIKGEDGFLDTLNGVDHFFASDELEIEGIEIII